MRDHPELEQLLRFLGGLDGEERDRLAHLLSCRRCNRQARELPRRSPARVLGFPVRGYDAVLDRFEQAFGALLAGRRDAVAEVTSDSPSVGVVRFLDESAEALLRDSRRAGDLARCALVRVAAMGGSEHRLGRDLEGRAWILLGQAQRLCGELGEASESLEHAERCLEGSWDPVDNARLLHARAIQWRSQGCFGEAFEALRQAGLLYEEVGDLRRKAHVLASTGALFFHQGHPVRAVPPLKQALALSRGEEDDEGIFAARHNLALCFAELGQVPAAGRLWEGCRDGYERFWGDPVQWRGLCLEASLAACQGGEEKAERLYLFVRDWLRARGDLYQNALVSLDLARLYARRGATECLRTLVGELGEELAASPVHPEALGAFAQLRRVVTTSAPSPARVREATLAFRRSRFRP